MKTAKEIKKKILELQSKKKPTKEDKSFLYKLYQLLTKRVSEHDRSDD